MDSCVSVSVSPEILNVFLVLAAASWGQTPHIACFHVASERERRPSGGESR